MKALSLVLSLFGASSTLAQTAPEATVAAPAPTYALAFGPFVGGGSISNGSSVKNVNGYALSLERRWMLTPSVGLGPVFEVANAFVATKERSADAKINGTYDNRFVSAGFRLSHAVGNDHTFAQALYFTGLAGRGFSKLSITDSAAESTRQSDFGHIRGNFFAGELGAFVPLKGSFGLNLAVNASQYRADQSQATGTFAGDQLVDGNLSLTQGSYDAANNQLDRTVTMRSMAGKIGVSLGF